MAQTLQACSCQNNSIIQSFVQLTQTGINVAAQVTDFQIRTLS